MSSLAELVFILVVAAFAGVVAATFTSAGSSNGCALRLVISTQSLPSPVTPDRLRSRSLTARAENTRMTRVVRTQ